jgi:hypothetical protein
MLFLMLNYNIILNYFWIPQDCYPIKLGYNYHIYNAIVKV